jgi:hypothetical protein
MMFGDSMEIDTTHPTYSQDAQPNHQSLFTVHETPMLPLWAAYNLNAFPSSSISSILELGGLCHQGGESRTELPCACVMLQFCVLNNPTAGGPKYHGLHVMQTFVRPLVISCRVS